MTEVQTGYFNKLFQASYSTRISNYRVWSILFHKTSESDNTLAELYSILNLITFLKCINFQCKPAKINYLLKYILGNKQ